jgi:hypothetical protein
MGDLLGWFADPTVVGVVAIVALALNILAFIIMEAKRP